MQFTIERIFDHASNCISAYSDTDGDEAYIMDFICQKYLPAVNGKLEDNFMIEFRNRPFESPIYIFASRLASEPYVEEHEYQLLILTERDAKETGNFILIDEIASFKQRNQAHN